MNEAHYQIRLGRTGKFHWVLVAPNNEVIGTSKNVGSVQLAEIGITESQMLSADPDNYERIDASESDYPRFNLRTKDKKAVSLRSESYTSVVGRENGIRACIEYGQTTKIIYPK